jgi:hypothetical protein
MTSDDTSVRPDGAAALVGALRLSIKHPEGAADHIETLASSNLPAPSKLAMLAHLKDKNVGRDGLVHLAMSLVRDDLPDDAKTKVANQLVDRVVHAPGLDPLGRKGLDTDPKTFALMKDLVPEVAATALSVLPSCQATRAQVDGQPVLFVKTQMWSTNELARFEPVIDPQQWPNCPVQSQFFKKMVPKDPQDPKEPLDKPDTGWRMTLEETVDFGFDVGPMVTDLEFVFHSNSTSIGCTYSMPAGGSHGGKIQHDEGYLLAEDLGGSRGARRITTMKAVWFRDKNTPVEEVCPVWSLAAGLVAHSCLQE